MCSQYAPGSKSGQVLPKCPHKPRTTPPHKARTRGFKIVDSFGESWEQTRTCHFAHLGHAWTDKSWLPGPYSQCKSERIAREVLTNHGFQDHTPNAREREKCTRCVNKSWFPGPYSQCKTERIAREVLTNHGFQDHTRNARVSELQKRC